MILKDSMIGCPFSFVDSLCTVAYADVLSG
jgi:hypothetical protein